MNPLSILNASIKRIPANKYALGVVGVVAAAALCIRLAGGEWLVAIAGGVAMLVGMVVLRVFASPGSPGAVGNSPSYQAAVLVWTCLFAFVCVLSLLVGKFYFVLFPTVASQLVDLTLVAVYSDDIGESAQTVFTIRPTETGPIYNEVMTGKDGTTKISLAAGKYILDAVGAPKALPFEVKPPGTTITVVIGRKDGHPELSKISVTTPQTPSNVWQLVSCQRYSATSRTLDMLGYLGHATAPTNGSMSNNTGPFYAAAPGAFPYIVLDQARNLLLLHPGTAETKDQAAVVSVKAPSNGSYDVSGSFARANDYLNAGDGVRVVVCTNGNFLQPNFESVITSAHQVDSAKPFQGEGVAAFHFSIALEQGEAVQFGVFNAKLLDGSYDVTALQATIKSEAVLISFPHDFPSQ